MEEWMITTPFKDLDFSKVLAIKNVDQRREVINRIGIDNMLQVFSVRTEDKQESYELLRVDLSDTLKNCTYLKMINPSTGKYHIEGVDDSCRKVTEALNWRTYKDKKRKWEPCTVT
jgi:hypothetical protein